MLFVYSIHDQFCYATNKDRKLAW